MTAQDRGLTVQVVRAVFEWRKRHPQSLVGHLLMSPQTITLMVQESAL